MVSFGGKSYHSAAIFATHHTAVHIFNFSFSMGRPPEEEVLTFIKQLFAYQFFVIMRIKLPVTPHKSTVNRILQHIQEFKRRMSVQLIFLAKNKSLPQSMAIQYAIYSLSTCTIKNFIFSNHYSAFCSSVSTFLNESSAVSRLSTISSAKISGSGRFSRLSKLSSLSQVISRLTLSRLIISS